MGAVQKLADYAKAGIHWYWVVDLEPHARIQVHSLHEGGYRLDGTTGEGHRLRVEDPFPVEFDPAVLLEPPFD